MVTNNEDLFGTDYFAGEEAYDPYEQFQRRMYSQMLPRTGAVGTEPYRRLERAAGRGFAPAFGEWLLSQPAQRMDYGISPQGTTIPLGAYDRGSEYATIPTGISVQGTTTPTFGQWYDARTRPDYTATGDPTTAFQNLAALSATYGGSGVLTEAEQAARLASQYFPYLNPATREARGITSYMLGGPTRGYLGRLQEGRAQRLSDLFGRLRMQQGSDVYGRPVESYFDWLQSVLPGMPGSAAQAAAASPAEAAAEAVAAGTSGRDEALGTYDVAGGEGPGLGILGRLPVEDQNRFRANQRIWETNPGSQGVWYQAFQEGEDLGTIIEGLRDIGVSDPAAMIRHWGSL